MKIRPYPANFHKDADAFIFESERPATYGLKDMPAVIWFWHGTTETLSGISLQPEEYQGQAIYLDRDEAREFANFILEHIK